MSCNKTNRLLLLFVIFALAIALQAQPGGITWSKDGNSYYTLESGDIIQYVLPANTKLGPSSNKLCAAASSFQKGSA